MKIWEEDTLIALSGITDEYQLFTAVAKSAKSIGFDYCAYGARTPVPVSRPRLVLFSNYTSSWQEQYASNNYIEVDPTVQHGFRSTAPIIWTPAGTKGTAEEMWGNAHDHGLRHGWAQASRDGNGMVGMLTLARGSNQISDEELQSNQAKMSWLVSVAHNAMSSIMSPKLIPESMLYFTPREREVLKWTAEGKTAGEVGIILSISVGTVNFHVNNIIVKLNACNKTQAVVKAALCGLLN